MSKNWYKHDILILFQFDPMKNNDIFHYSLFQKYFSHLIISNKYDCLKKCTHILYAYFITCKLMTITEILLVRSVQCLTDEFFSYVVTF